MSCSLTSGEGAAGAGIRAAFTAGVGAEATLKHTSEELRSRGQFRMSNPDITPTSVSSLRAGDDRRPGDSSSTQTCRRA